MSSVPVKRKQLALLIGDGVSMYLALVCMILLRYHVDNFSGMLAQHLVPFTTIFVVWCVIIYANGLYDLVYAKPSVAFYRRLAPTWITALLFGIALFYLVPLYNITPKTNLLIVGVIFCLLFVAWRALATALYSTRGHIRVLVLSPDTEMLELITTLQHNPQLGYTICGIVGEHTTIDGIKIFSPTTALRALVAEHEIALVVVGASRDHTPEHRELYELLFWNVQVIEGSSFFEAITGRVALASVDDEWFLKNMHTDQFLLYDTLHIFTDYLFAAFGFVLLCIATPCMYLITALTSPGPLFYRQERVGKNGARFQLLKFRTMHKHATDGGAEVNGVQFTSPNDPRIIRFGRTIRRLRIDELPQIINILKGHMSLVGPRPERPEFIQTFELHMPFYTIRHLVKPGLTGWAQINFSYAETMAQHKRKFEYDLFYLKNRSFFLDITIILKTVRVIVTGTGR